jgi:hypothetical protein
VQTLKPLRIRSTIILILLCAALAIAAPAQTFTSVADLDSANGSFPLRNGLVQGTDGNFYGTAFSGGARNLPEPSSSSRPAEP